MSVHGVSPHGFSHFCDEGAQLEFPIYQAHTKVTRTKHVPGLSTPGFVGVPVGSHTPKRSLEFRIMIRQRCSSYLLSILACSWCTRPFRDGVTLSMPSISIFSPSCVSLMKERNWNASMALPSATWSRKLRYCCCFSNSCSAEIPRACSRTAISSFKKPKV